MLKVVGNPLFISYAQAFDVSENTIKTWRHRGAVSLQYLAGFAREHGESLDWLLYGKKNTDTQGEVNQANQEVAPYGPIVSPVLRLFVKQISGWVANGQLKDEDIEVLAGMASRLAGPEPAVVPPPPPRARPVVPTKPPLPKSTSVITTNTGNQSAPPKKRKHDAK